MKSNIIVAATIVLNFLCLSSSIFSMDHDKHLLKKSMRSKSCPNLLKKYKNAKKSKFKKDDEIWKSFSFLVRRLDDSEKQQRKLIYHANQTASLILELRKKVDELTQKTLANQDCIVRLQENLKILLEDKSKRLELKKLKKRKKPKKDDSTGLSSLVSSLPFPEEPIVKERPNDENLSI